MTDAFNGPVCRLDTAIVAVYQPFLLSWTQQLWPLYQLLLCSSGSAAYGGRLHLTSRTPSLDQSVTFTGPVCHMLGRSHLWGRFTSSSFSASHGLVTSRRFSSLKYNNIHTLWRRSDDRLLRGASGSVDNNERLHRCRCASLTRSTYGRSHQLLHKSS